MVVERTSGTTSYIEVLDRVLDKGIVLDAWIVMSVAGIDLITVRANVVVASIDTYLSFVAKNRVLFIVAANRPAPANTPWPQSSTTWTSVVIDRRRRERRRKARPVPKDRRRVERRTHNVERELRSLGMAAVVLP